MRDKDDGPGLAGLGAWLIMLLPVMIIGFIGMMIGYYLAAARASFKVIKIACLPLALVLSNMMFAPAFFVVAVLSAVFFNTELSLATFADLSGYMVWGPVVCTAFSIENCSYAPTTESWAVVAYQVACYLLLGRRMLRQLTLTVVDLVIAKKEAQVDEAGYWATDPEYLEFYEHYHQKQVKPTLSTVLIWWMGSSTRDRYLTPAGTT